MALLLLHTVLHLLLLRHVGLSVDRLVSEVLSLLEVILQLDDVGDPLQLGE